MTTDIDSGVVTTWRPNQTARDLHWGLFKVMAAGTRFTPGGTDGRWVGLGIETGTVGQMIGSRRTVTYAPHMPDVLSCSGEGER